MKQLLHLAVLHVAAAFPWYLVDVPLAVCGGEEAVTLLLPLLKIPRADRSQPHVLSVIRSTGNVSFVIKAEDMQSKLVANVEVALEGPKASNSEDSGRDSTNSTQNDGTTTSTTLFATSTTTTANDTAAAANEHAQQSTKINAARNQEIIDATTKTGDTAEVGKAFDTDGREFAEFQTAPAVGVDVEEMFQDALGPMSFAIHSSRQLSSRRGGFGGRRGGRISPPRRRFSSPRRRFSPPRRRYSRPRRRFSSPRRRFSPPRRRYSPPRRRSYRPIQPPHQPPAKGWQNPAHPGAHYNYRPPTGYKQQPYGFNNNNYYRPHRGNGAKIAMAGAAGFVGGAAAGHMLSGSRYSRWNTMGYGHRRGHHGQGESQWNNSCYNQDFKGNCSSCFERFGAENCTVSYDFPEAASRDDLMATAFIPKDYSRALRVTLTRITGSDLARERICPPDGWHWDPKLNNYTSTWVPPDKQDIFITLTKVEKMTEPQPVKPKPNHMNSGKGTDAMLKALYVLLAIVGSILLCCLCCCCGNKSGTHEMGRNEVEMQGFGTVGAAPVYSSSVAVPGAATPIAPAYAAAGPGAATPIAPAYAAAGTMAAACSRHTFRINDRQPAHSPNEWLVSARIGFGAVAAAPVFSSAAAVTPHRAMGSTSPSSAKTCPQTHPLQLGINQSDETACDECHEDLRRGDQLYSCDVCDFDVCTKCSRLTSFVDDLAYQGPNSWRNFLVNEPIVDSQGLLAGAWGDALRAAVLYEMRYPGWPQEERFFGPRNGPAGQVIAFLDAKGFGMFEATAEHTENVLKENPQMLRIP